MPMYPAVGFGFQTEGRYFYCYHYTTDFQKNQPKKLQFLKTFLCTFNKVFETGFLTGFFGVKNVEKLPKNVKNPNFYTKFKKIGKKLLTNLKNGDIML